MKKYFITTTLLTTVGVLSIIFYSKMNPEFLPRLSYYANLANPSMRIVRVAEGSRREEIAEVLMDKLNWNEQDRVAFLRSDSINVEGHYFPKTYIIHKDETPSVVAATMFDEFSKQVEKIKEQDPQLIINENTALKIASIIQREAAGKEDMKLISGVIWNRIFDGMKLQIDATLQYVKGNEEEGWWKQVDPDDKEIESPYNTYLYKGLPPAPIANPGPDAIAAAFYPQKTDCMFYLHDRNRKIHCAKTYAGHKRNIEIYLK
jgi:UPF0755 protein